jgi:hypothetical protein
VCGVKIMASGIGSWWCAHVTKGIGSLWCANVARGRGSLWCTHMERGIRSYNECLPV